MSATATRAATTISLEDGCCDSAMPADLHAQLTAGRYQWPCSTLRLPDDLVAYLAAHRTAKRRARRAQDRSYGFAEVDRTLHVDHVYAINTSAENRQGRPMAPSYFERPTYSPNPLLCRRHHVYTYGVLTGGVLVAYCWLYRSGELAMVSSILGHAAVLADEVMYLLLAGTIAAQAELGGTLFYNMHNSGTDGLRFFKERFGLAPARVEWAL